VIVRKETDQPGLAQSDGAAGAGQSRKDGSDRSFWQTMASTGETSESVQSAARTQTEAQIDTGHFMGSKAACFCGPGLLCL